VIEHGGVRSVDGRSLARRTLFSKAPGQTVWKTWNLCAGVSNWYRDGGKAPFAFGTRKRTTLLCCERNDFIPSFSSGATTTATTTTSSTFLSTRFTLRAPKIHFSAPDNTARVCLTTGRPLLSPPPLSPRENQPPTQSFLSPKPTTIDAPLSVAPSRLISTTRQPPSAIVQSVISPILWWCFSGSWSLPSEGRPTSSSNITE